MRRRDFLASLAPTLIPWASLTGAGAQSSQAPQPAAPRIYLDEYQPKSALVVAGHPVARARFPIINVHAHLNAMIQLEPGAMAERIDQALHSMDQANIQTLVDLTGGTGDILKRNIAELQNKHRGRFLVCTEPSYNKYAEKNYPDAQARDLEKAKKAGAVGLKVVKTLGLVLRERITDGKLVKIDDPRFDPMWEAAGNLKLPVFIHISDPDAFFTPIDKFNERYEELQHHPDWSFYGKDFPSKKELLAQRNRVIERHPRTTFVSLHVANHPENLDEVSEWLRRYPNMHCEIAARLGELGRQPRRARKFFDEFPDRIMFGTDGTGAGAGIYGPYFRFFETLDEYFDYSNAAIPTQGRWKIYGIGLPDAILKKVYHDNAARLLGLAQI